ncbi:MAG: flagellar basal body rod protein FlgB [Pseudomonadota bacterium]
MTFSISTPHEQFMGLHAKRSEVLSSNIANADTPGYKARDYNFADALKQIAGDRPSVTMKQTHTAHRNTWSDNALNAQLEYRVPTQPTLDGNTVEMDVEQAAFAENALKYRTSLRFVDGYFKSLRFAIRGTD